MIKHLSDSEAITFGLAAVLATICQGIYKLPLVTFLLIRLLVYDIFGKESSSLEHESSEIANIKINQRICTDTRKLILIPIQKFH